MAEILITGMEMPKYCLEAIGDNYKVVKICPFRELCIRKWGGYIGALNVHSDACPLVEVQAHGDLIDRQKLLEHRFEVYDSNEELCEDYIETYHVLEAPAIIEASKERE